MTASYLAGQSPPFACAVLSCSQSHAFHPLMAWAETGAEAQDLQGLQAARLRPPVAASWAVAISILHCQQCLSYSLLPHIIDWLLHCVVTCRQLVHPLTSTPRHGVFRPFSLYIFCSFLTSPDRTLNTRHYSGASWQLHSPVATASG